MYVSLYIHTQSLTSTKIGYLHRAKSLGYPTVVMVFGSVTISVFGAKPISGINMLWSFEEM